MHAAGKVERNIYKKICRRSEQRNITVHSYDLLHYLILMLSMKYAGCIHGNLLINLRQKLVCFSHEGLAVMNDDDHQYIPPVLQYER